MAKLHLKDYRVSAIIGVLPQERQLKQEIAIDVEFELNGKKAARSDHIKDTVDYAQVCAHIQQFVSHSHYQLIETLAEKLADHLSLIFKIKKLKLILKKKPADIPELESVSVVVKR